MRSLLTVITSGMALIVSTTTAQAADGEPPASPEVTAAMQPYLDQYKLAGVIGIIADRSGKVHYKNLLGYADVEAKKPISEDNVFWIASMTKMFAGASIMMLVDEGKVSLDDPVTKFIPQLDKWMVVEEKDQSHVLLKPPVRPVTIRHVLSHTSGLAGSSELQQVTGSDSTPLKARALSSVTGPLQWQPGDKYAYGNQGMNIAARIVEIVSGMPYEEFLQKRFFDPLGMTETTFWPSEAQVARLAGAYGPNKQKNGLRPGRHRLPDQAVERSGSPFSRGRGRPVLHHARHLPLRPDAGQRRRAGWQALPVARGDGRAAEGANREDQGQLQPGLSSPQRHVRPRRGLRHRSVRQSQDGDGGHFHGAMHRAATSGRPAICSSRRPRRSFRNDPSDRSAARCSPASSGRIVL